MKIQILLVFAAFVCCNAQSTGAPATSAKPFNLKDEIIRRVGELDTKIKAEIKKLEDNKREHLALGLKWEQQRVDNLTQELKTTDPGPEALRLLEHEIIEIGSRLSNEVKFIEGLNDSTTKTEEMLITMAMNLRRWVEQEVEKLTKDGQHQRVVEVLHEQEKRLIVIAFELEHSQNMRELQRYEIELRFIERRVAEELKRLGFKPDQNTPTPAPATTVPTKVPTGPTTIHPTHPSRPTDATAATTTSALPNKEELLKKSVELLKTSDKEIEKLKAENRTSLTTGLLSIEKNVKNIAQRLNKATGEETTEILDSELSYWEKRLVLEVNYLEALIKMIDKLLGISAALKQRIDLGIKVLANTPVGKALAEEAKNLEKVAKQLKAVTNEQTLETLEVDLSEIEDRVNIELQPIGLVTTPKPF